MLNLEELKLIKACFLFSGISEQELNCFLESEDCFVYSFLKGEIILSDIQGVGIVLSGKASANYSDNGFLRTFCAGEIFGAASAFSNADSEPFSKMKAINNCRVFFVTKSGIEKLICLNPKIAIKYITFLSDRVAFLNRRISTFTAKEAISRVAKYLLDNCDGNFVCKNINFSALAKNLDIGRASLYRVKNQLIELKAIAVDKKDIIVIDRDALINII